MLFTFTDAEFAEIEQEKVAIDDLLAADPIKGYYLISVVQAMAEHRIGGDARADARRTAL